MNREELLNQLLVMTFNEIMDAENRALITGAFKEISINDVHIIDAVGIAEPRNMSTVAKKMSVTVGTLTTAINNLVKKGYVSRIRSAEDKRVVLLSLTEKGRKVYRRHDAYHKKMVQTVMEGLGGEEMEATIADVSHPLGMPDLPALSARPGERLELKFDVPPDELSLWAWKALDGAEQEPAQVELLPSSRDFLVPEGGEETVYEVRAGWHLAGDVWGNVSYLFTVP